MPGFHFTYTLERNENIRQGLQDDESNVLCKEWPFSLSANALPYYPLISWRENDFHILFEGIIYDIPLAELKQKIQAFCAQQLTEQQLQSWLHQRDGEYVLFILNIKSHQLWLWNDVFGRLPVYLFQQNEKLIISRNIQHIRNSSENTHFDAFGLATLLLFGYALGNKSLWEGINYLPPGAQLKADFKAGKIDISKGFEAFRFGDDKPPQTEIWIESLSNALENRLEKLPNAALSLSGGLDSRLIASLLKKLESKIPAFTYHDAEGSAAADVLAVDEMVKRLHWDAQHKFISLEFNTVAQTQQLMQMKQGLNYAGMAFLLPFLKFFAKQNHPMITGDGGDKLLADLRPLIHLRNPKQLLNYLLREHGRTTLESAARWSGLSAKALKDYLFSHLESYQEAPDKTYSQFLLRERALKWLFEGEDRNRDFCWTTTPYYSLPFARQALEVNMSAKAHGKLFLQLFQQLPGRLEEIVNPNWQQPLSNQKAIQQLYRRQQIKQHLKKLTFFKKLLSEKENSLISKDISESQLENLVDHGLSINLKELKNIKNVALQDEIFGLALLINDKK